MLGLGLAVRAVYESGVGPKNRSLTSIAAAAICTQPYGSYAADMVLGGGGKVAGDGGLPQRAADQKHRRSVVVEAEEAVDHAVQVLHACASVEQRLERGVHLVGVGVGVRYGRRGAGGTRVLILTSEY